MARTTQSAFEYGATKVKRTIILKNVAANVNVPIPGGARLEAIHIFNKTANAVTGGIRIGSAAAGTQHLTAQAVAANGLYFAAPTVQAPIVQTAGALFIEAVTAWNSAVLDIRIEYEELTLPTVDALVNGVNLVDPLGRH